MNRVNYLLISLTQHRYRNDHMRWGKSEIKLWPNKVNTNLIVSLCTVNIWVKLFHKRCMKKMALKYTKRQTLWCIKGKDIILSCYLIIDIKGIKRKKRKACSLDQVSLHLGNRSQIIISLGTCLGFLLIRKLGAHRWAGITESAFVVIDMPRPLRERVNYQFWKHVTPASSCCLYIHISIVSSLCKVL